MRRSTMLLGLLLVAALGGCGSNEFSPLSGTVTYQGKPLESGTVSFKHKKLGTTGYGQLQAGGTYTVKTGRNEGLKSGDYDVYVVAAEIIKGDANSAPNVKLTIPARYADPESSGLRCTVPTKDGTYDIVLEK